MKVATLTIELDGENCFVVANGIRIAKRGNELNWISLEPGWAVYSRKFARPPQALDHRLAPGRPPPQAPPSLKRFEVD